MHVYYTYPFIFLFILVLSSCEYLHFLANDKDENSKLYNQQTNLAEICYYQSNLNTESPEEIVRKTEQQAQAMENGKCGKYLTK